MKIQFRHGIVRQQLTDLTRQPNFLQLSSDGQTVRVYCSPDPTIITIAHTTTDYLFEESVTIDAWNGPFPPSKTMYLYWDIDILSGERTFGKTEYNPITASSTPSSPHPDQHWFDLKNMVMKVWNGSTWTEKLRVFAGHVANGGLLIQYPTGTQVGVNDTAYAGSLLFDDEGKPIKKYDRFNRGKFITTETPMSSQFPRIANFRLEPGMNEGKAVEHVPKWHAVCLKGPNELGLASYEDVNRPAIGIALEDMYTSEVRGFHTKGFLTDPNWNWTVPPGSPLFVGVTGELTASPPQYFSIQTVGTVVSKHQIYIDIQPQILYEDA